jgi:hypothetical protein
MSSPKRPQNNQRRTLPKQGLQPNTSSNVLNAHQDSVSHLVTLNLDVAVFGVPGTPVVKGSTATAVATASAVTVVSPNQLTAAFAAAVITAWVDDSGGLRTASNGGISPRPKAIT